MKKFFRTCICMILLFAMALTVTACGDEDENSQDVVSVPYEVNAIATTSISTWEHLEGGSVFRSQSQLKNYLTKIRNQFEKSPDDGTWSMKTDENAEINEDYFLAQFDNNYFKNKALIVSVFYTPNTPAKVVSHYAWKQAGSLHVEIEYIDGDLTALSFGMIIMEVAQTDVKNVKEVIVEASRPKK